MYSALTQDPLRSPREVRLNPNAPNAAASSSSSPPALSDDAPDVIQFSSAIYIVNVDEGRIQADIMRIGQMKGDLSFKYQTANASAVAGEQYEHVSGTLTMRAGEDSAVIEVPIVNSTRWNPTTEFLLSLHSPNGCTLGLYLKTARIKVLDAAAFPSDKFKKQIAEGEDGIRSINKFELFGHFLYQMYQQDGIWWRTALTIFLDQLNNVYIYLKLWISVYMVDHVLNFNKDPSTLFIPGNRMSTLYVLAILTVGPMLVLYAADMLKIRMDIQGKLQRDLTRNLFRKFMNYNKQSREEVPTPDCVVSLTQDAKEVTHGYINALRMLQLAGKLVISIFFTLSQNPSAWWACLLVPSIMIAWGYTRTNAYIEASQAKGDKEGEVTVFVNEALNKIKLIADYFQRPQMNEMFADKSEGLRNMQIPERFVVHNNMFLPHLLGPGLVAIYTAVGGSMVLEQSMKLGVYLATISVFGEICAAFADFFSQVMNIIGTFAPLVGITLILNKPTDVPAWKVVSRKRRALTKEFRAEILSRRKNGGGSDSSRSFVPAADEMEIKLVDMVFGHPGGSLLFQNLNFSAKQGSICAIVGEPGRGRRTLLELIAHKMFPDDGTLFIPSHLRVLFVSADSVLLNLSLWQNLTFGNSKGNDPFRVERILKGLNMDEALSIVKPELTARKKELGNSVSDEEEEEQEETAVSGLNPLEKLRASQKANLHIARALIMNPEVMVMDRPFAHYPKAGDDKSAELILDVLTAHRNNRGFEMDPNTKNSRRPRTLFFTPDTRWEAQMADFCWILPKKIGGPCTSDSPASVWPDTGQSLESSKPSTSALVPAPAPAVVPPVPLAHQQNTEQKSIGTVHVLTALEPPPIAQHGVHDNAQTTGDLSRDYGGAAPVVGHSAESISSKIEKLMQDRIMPPSQSTLLKQELLALGPRPMSTFNAAARASPQRMSPHHQRMDSPPRMSHSPPVDRYPPPQAGYNHPDAYHEWGEQPKRPPGYVPLSADRKVEQHDNGNRRCCGP